MLYKLAYDMPLWNTVFRSPSLPVPLDKGNEDSEDEIGRNL